MSEETSGFVTALDEEAYESEDLFANNAADEAALPDPYDDDDADDDDEIVDDEEYEDDGAKAYMQNRELSWLTFDERVLDQGADESVPLLERLNFISIFCSNLQEFFMVRVGSLTDLSFIDPPVIDSKTGMTPNDQIKAIHERCHELYPIQESTYEHVRGQLAKEGVRHLRPDDLSEEQRNYLFGLVRHNIEPFLSPQIINARHPFPHLENGKLYILVRLDDEANEPDHKKKKKKKAKKDKGGAEGVVLGLIPLPHQCERVIKLPGRGYQFILLEHAIEMFVPEIFSMYKIKHTNVICVTRNADIDANQGFDEQDEDYREHMKRLLKKRARLAPVRLECERPLSPVMEKVMLKKLGLKRFQMYDTIVPLDLSFTWGLGSRLSDKKRERLSNPPFTPAWPTCLNREERIMDQVSKHDVLLSYPYESIDPFVQLLREAANDPDVISIKITLYRLASQSHIAEALIAAADAGKEVTALFELRARFDENNNIEWSQRFEQAGCNVLYGFRDYKVHSKICCITRRTPDGSIQRITQLGTGNYNEKTARLYTDFAFITVDETFGRDAVEFFRNMQLENVSDNYEILRVAPLQIKTMVLENLDRQIERAQQGLPASAFMKANSITDKDVIEKISEASNAGVRITLFIRGICCLVPRVKGATENVRVVSIVGRLLEHSRIYCFGSTDDCVVYLSSADLMTRNLNKRVEIAWPLPGGEIRDKVLSYIDVCMHDTAKLRELRPNATYTPLGAFCDLDEDGNPEPSFDAQTALIKLASEGAAKAAEATVKEEVEATADVLPEIPEEPEAALLDLSEESEASTPELADEPEAAIPELTEESEEATLELADDLSDEESEGTVAEELDNDVSDDDAIDDGAVIQEPVSFEEPSTSEDIQGAELPAVADVAMEDADFTEAAEPPVSTDDILEEAEVESADFSEASLETDEYNLAGEDNLPAPDKTKEEDLTELSIEEILSTDYTPTLDTTPTPVDVDESLEATSLENELAHATVEEPITVEEVASDEPTPVSVSALEGALANAAVADLVAVETPAIVEDDASPLEATASDAVSEAESTPESEADDANSASADESPSHEEPRNETANSYDRVSELIAQLSATPGQSVPLQEMPIQPLQTLQSQALDEVLAESEASDKAEETQPNEPLADMKVSDIVSDTNAVDENAVSAEPEEQPADDVVQEATAAEPEVKSEEETPAPDSDSKPETSTAESKPADGEEREPGIFEAHREIEMPPKKKRGLFSRLLS